MVSLSNNTQGNVNITTRNGAGVNLTSNNDTDVNANTNGNAQRAKSWAVGEGLIDGVDYSAKYYAGKAKESAEQASGGVEAITEAKEQALSAIDTEKTVAIADMETAKSEKISEIENTAADFEDDLEALTTRAETAATNAETSETNAATSATSANTSATNASNSATSAATNANLAENYKNDAYTYANSAASSRNAAKSYADNANEDMTTALNAAAEARTSANSASQSATTANNAKNVAESARDAAGNYAQQAEQAKDDIEAELDNYVPNTRKVNNKPLSTDITLTSSDVGALANTTKYGYSVALSLDTTNYKLTLTLKDQDGTALSTKTVDFPIESVVVNGSYNSANKKIVLTLQNGNTIDIPVGDLISGLQTEITSTNKLDADLVDDSSSSHKFATAAQLNQIATNTSSISNLASVATSGDYTDLTNKPTIPTVPTNISAFTNDSGYITKSVNNLTNYTLSNNLATVATSGSYNDLSNKPTIPDAQVQADWDVADTTSKAYIKNKPYIPSGVVVDQTYDGTSTNAQSGVAIAGALTSYVTTNTNQEITNYKTFKGNSPLLSFRPNNSANFSLGLDFGFMTDSNSFLYYTNRRSVDSIAGLLQLSTFGNSAPQLALEVEETECYRIVTPTADNAKTPFNLSSTFTNFYFPLGFTDGTNTVKTANTGLVDISTLLPTVPTNISAFTNDAGYITSIPSGYVQNTATATNSLTILGTTNNQNNSILIGYSTTTSSTNSTVIGNTAVSGGSYATALGYYARANDQYTTAIGNNSYANYQDVTAVGHNSQATAAGTLAVGSNSKATAQRATSIGYSSQATQYQATALGYEAKATANSALQIGTGTNSTANTLQVGSYTLLNTSTGLIPDARISSNIARTSDLSGYVQASNGNMTFANAGTEGDILYTNSTTGEFYGVIIGQSSTYGTGVTIGAGNSLAQNGYMLNLSLNGLGLIDASNMGTALLTVSNSNLAVNGSEVVTGDNTRFDGQWVNSSVELANNVSMTSSTQDYSLSSYLPNDNYDYEVMFNCNITSGTSTGNRIYLAVATDISSYTEMAYAMPRSNASVIAYGFCILPVGSGRKVTVAGNTNPKGTYQLGVRGYRRIGTNT